MEFFSEKKRHVGRRKKISSPQTRRQVSATDLSWVEMARP